MITQHLPGGVKRIVHVLAKNLQHNRDHGTTLPVVAVRPADEPSKMFLYHEVEITGPSKLCYMPTEPLPNTEGRATCYLHTDAALVVTTDAVTVELNADEEGCD